jgi:hypothetical protein
VVTRRTVLQPEAQLSSLVAEASVQSCLFMLNRLVIVHHQEERFDSLMRSDRVHIYIALLERKIV